MSEPKVLVLQERGPWNVMTTAGGPPWCSTDGTHERTVVHKTVQPVSLGVSIPGGFDLRAEVGAFVHDGEITIVFGYDPLQVLRVERNHEHGILAKLADAEEHARRETAWADHLRNQADRDRKKVAADRYAESWVERLLEWQDNGGEEL